MSFFYGTRQDGFRFSPGGLPSKPQKKGVGGDPQTIGPNQANGPGPHLSLQFQDLTTFSGTKVSSARPFFTKERVPPVRQASFAPSSVWIAMENYLWKEHPRFNDSRLGT